MAIIILWLIVFGISRLVMLYVHDSPSFPNGKIEGLSLPSVRDLPENESISSVDQYVKEEILPAHSFILLHNECLSSNNDAGSNFLNSILQFLPVFIACLTVYRNSDGYKRIVFLVTSLICFFAVWWGISKSYSKFFKIRSFNDGPDSLKKEYQYLIDHNYLTDFSINDKRRFENFVIDKYHSYYSAIAESMRRRSALAYFLNLISAFIYITYLCNL